MTNYGSLPLSFIKNAGQIDPSVKFQVNGANHAIFFTPETVVFRGLSEDSQTAPTVIRSTLVHSNPNSQIEGLTKLPGVANFIQGIGENTAEVKTITDVPTYDGIIYRGVYAGIDRVFKGNEGQLKSEFIVRPYSNPDQIKLEFTGVESLQLGDDGSLILKTGQGELVEAPLVVYQEINGQRVSVSGNYQILNDRTVGFQLGNYNPEYTLVIDPVLEYSSYLGGNSDEQGGGVAVDDQGNVYLTGATQSTNFPTTSGAYNVNNAGQTDVFVTKLDAKGTTRLYSTYIGGSGQDVGIDLAVDSTGATYIAAQTNSKNLPTTFGAQQRTSQNQASTAPGEDSFIAKLNPAGNGLVYLTYLSGNDLDKVAAIAIDSTGNAYVTGETRSQTFPVTPATFQTSKKALSDIFVSKLNATGTSLIYSTFIGGENTEIANDIALGPNGVVYVVGETDSTTLPVTPGAHKTTLGGGIDGFIFALNARGDGFIYGTYLGGNDFDSVSGVAVDSTGNAYLTGQTNSSNFSTTASGFQGTLNNNNDAFVVRFNATGALDYGTYWGGAGVDIGRKIAVDSGSRVYVTGTTTSSDLTTTADGKQRTYGGGGDSFIGQISKDGKLSYGSYLGGSGADEAKGLAIDPFGGAYLIGSTTSNNFPTTTGVVQTSLGGGTDAFISKFSFVTDKVKITESSNNTTVTEGSGTDSYQIVLLEKPTDNVIINATNDSQIRLSRTTLTFTEDNWDIPQSISVTPNNDKLAEGLHTSRIIHTISQSPPEFADLILPNVNVNINDNDVEFSIKADRPLFIEGDQVGPYPLTFTVTRRGDISQSSSVDFTVTGTATEGSDYLLPFKVSGTNVSGGGDTIIFDSGGATATLTIDVAGDPNDEGNEDVIVTLSNPSSSDGASIAVGSDRAIIVDDEKPGISFYETDGDTLVSEDGLLDSYQVILNKKPTSNVNLEFVVDSQLQPIAFITFTPDNWNVARTINVAAVNDATFEGFIHTGTIAHKIGSGSAPEYLAANISLPSLTVDIIENEPFIPPPPPNIPTAIKHNTSSNIFTVEGNPGVQVPLRFALDFVNRTKAVNEIGVFKVDDDLGRVNGKSPGDAGYLGEALKEARIVLSALPESIFSNFNASRTLNFTAGDKLMFYLVQSNTTENIRRSVNAGELPAGVFFANGLNTVQISQNSAEKYTFRWEDQFGGVRDFNDLVMSLELTPNGTPALGAGLQGGQQQELVDLRALGKVKVNLDIRGEALYKNTVGLYRVDDEKGRIGNLSPGDAGYAEEAIRNRRVAAFQGNGNVSAIGEGILAPFLLSDITVESFLRENSGNGLGTRNVAYFPFLGANPDGFDHLRLFGDNTFGFEDLPNGGDFDYNDTVFQVTLG